MTRNLSVWNSLRPFSVGFDSIFEEFDRMLESTERHNSNYPPYNIHRINDNNYKIESLLCVPIKYVNGTTNKMEIAVLQLINKKKKLADGSTKIIPFILR